jgi:hypothetical protein
MLLQSIGLGFLCASRFGRENPCLGLLDFLGFPWILSSESGLINGLRDIINERFFSGLLSVAFAARNRGLTILAGGRAGLFMGRAYIGFWFSATICRPSRSLRRLISKADSFTIERHRRTAWESKRRSGGKHDHSAWERAGAIVRRRSVNACALCGCGDRGCGRRERQRHGAAGRHRVDCGPIVNPDRVRSQFEGTVVMGLGVGLPNEISFK